MITQHRFVPYLLLILLCLQTFSRLQAEEKKEYYVYQYVIESAQGTFEEISQAIENSALQNGWQILAKVDGGVPDDCPFATRVFVLYDSSYAKLIMDANAYTGPFAVVDRVNLFQDENGLHVSVVNPHSINRTILMDDEKYETMSEAHLQALRGMITAVVQGTISEKGYGPKRKKGYIGRTMGVMAGGSFDGKIQDVVVTDQPFPEVLAKVKDGLSQPGEKWGMHLVYELPLNAYGVVLLGTTGTPMDSKSFDIVKAGGDKSRKNLQCPGLAHAGAYPIEVVLRKTEKGVAVQMVDVMYRMKMYFEDAGKWAFMKNMGMPGAIHDEVKNQILNGLGMN